MQACWGEVGGVGTDIYAGMLGGGGGVGTDIYAGMLGEVGV